jgi:putative transposase
VVPGWAHHITQRGNRRQDVFHSDSQRRRYLQLLEQYASARGLVVRAYCLMTNHIHLVAVPPDADALAAVLKPVHLRYAQEYNRRTGLQGVLWQGRFYSCLLEGGHYWSAIRYVERNPVRAGLVARAQDYPWSSAGWRCGLRRDGLLPQPGPLDWPQWLWNMPRQEQRAGWSRWLAASEDETTLASLRHCTRTGRAAGDDTALCDLERQLGLRIRAMPRGRPKKSQPAGKGEEING